MQGRFKSLKSSVFTSGRLGKERNISTRLQLMLCNVKLEQVTWSRQYKECFSHAHAPVIQILDTVALILDT